MLDLFHLPPEATGNIQIFNQPSTLSSSLQWTTWSKPRGVSMVYILCIGGGAGGGGGFTDIAGNPRGGGGGGGSSGASMLLIPAILLSDIIFVKVGHGGAGVGSGGGTAGSGIHSVISLDPRSSLPISNVLLQSSRAAPTGGGTGTAAAGGAAGVAGTQATIGNSNGRAGIGIFLAYAGQGGSAGGAQTGQAGLSLNFSTIGIQTMGGSGGGGTTSANFDGGNILGTTESLASDWRPREALAGSNNGSGGVWIQKLYHSYPGLGGASSNAGVGGQGGKGGPGSGGGGGGGGTVGGTGGNGGNGLVIIVSW